MSSCRITRSQIALRRVARYALFPIIGIRCVSTHFQTPRKIKSIASEFCRNFVSEQIVLADSQVTFEFNESVEDNREELKSNKNLGVSCSSTSNSTDERVIATRSTRNVRRNNYPCVSLTTVRCNDNCTLDSYYCVRLITRAQTTSNLIKAARALKPAGIGRGANFSCCQTSVNCPENQQNNTRDVRKWRKGEKNKKKHERILI